MISCNISDIFLQVCLQYYEHEFMELACQCPAVVVCRCSPTQKADIVKLLKVHTKKRTCAIGKSVLSLFLDDSSDFTNIALIALSHILLLLFF